MVTTEIIGIPDHYTPHQIRAGNEELLALAAFVEKKAPEIGYNQMSIGNVECGAPGCLMGYDQLRLKGLKANEVLWQFCVRFALSYRQYYHIFDHDGCENAGSDWMKAVACVRAFVKQREEALR